MINKKSRNSSSKLVVYLFRFMLIFDINRFQLFSFSGGTIKARVGWADDGSPCYDEDEEVQDIEWDALNFEGNEDVFLLSEYLIDNCLISIDQITISEYELLNKLGWEEGRFSNALQSLLSFRVDMVDDGKRTDYFFVHF